MKNQLENLRKKFVDMVINRQRTEETGETVYHDEII